MAKINIQFDTVTKECISSIDDTVMSNMTDCSLYYDEYSGKYCISMRCNHSVGDDMTMMNSIYASKKVAAPKTSEDIANLIAAALKVK